MAVCFSCLVHQEEESFVALACLSVVGGLGGHASAVCLAWPAKEFPRDSKTP